MSITQINSDQMIPIEQNFRVSAGPGAGKTHWLTNHIKNVLHNSSRLAKSRKIACITYTNIAVEIILDRLGTSANQVEVNTIHSFLYQHVVKPYAKFISADYGLDVKKMDGHDDTILSNYSFIEEWKQRTKQQQINDHNAIVEAITAARWRFGKSGDLEIKPDYPRKIGKYSIKNYSYFEYKKMTWEKGVIHHEDVLFFSYQLVQKFPFILEVLRAKFPYFFVDEFQDTNPIQTKILEKIGQKETIVGIIGDQAQSIYGFQGADPLQFSTFTLPGIADYQMADNRRSTNQIIDLLNTIRVNDIQQNKFRNEEGDKPVIFVDEMRSALHRAKELCENEEVYSLSRTNITSNALKKDLNQNIPSEDLLQVFHNIDSNSDRKQLVLACIKATELAYEKKFKEAIKELERVFRDKENAKKEALRCICILLEKYNDFKDESLLSFYSLVKEQSNKKISELSKGKAKPFYEGHTYNQLAVCVKITDDISLHRTIHKAKGAQFNNVLLVLNDKADLSFLLKPDLEKEEHRINYVAISRAKERLFICVPTLLNTDRDKLVSSFSIL